MKLFVTGGAGFIGSNFIRYWLTRHPADRVVNFDSLTYAGNLENLTGVDQGENYQFIQGNITDSVAVAAAMAGCDIVVHFAAETHVDRSITGPGIFLTTNVLGTQVLLDAALKAGVKRFHHISTDEVFGALPLGTPDKFRETTPYAPRSPYAASKAASDHLIRAYGETFGLAYTITNCSNNFGPYQFPEKFLPLMITNVLENKPIPIYGDGQYVRDWLYVDDHCRAIELVLKKGKIGETYCIGGMTDDVSNLDIARQVLALMGKDESLLTYVKDRPGHDRRYAVDWSKAKTELGYAPAHDFATYLKQTVDWYITNESWWRRVKSGEYQAYYKKQYAA